MVVSGTAAKTEGPTDPPLPGPRERTVDTPG